MSDNAAAQGEHLPDCNDATDHQSMEFGGLCICAALRACEARAYVAGVERENRSYGFAFQQGLDAATEAVAALPATAWHCPDLTFAKAAKAEAIAAIAALRATP